MNQYIPFKASLLVAMTATAWSPSDGWAQSLNLAQSPPATVEPFVAPNVLISLDDSSSMQWRLTDTVQGIDQAAPGPNGWDPNVNRASILRNALTNVFSDQVLLPNGSIRLAWQTMRDCAAYSRRIDYSTQPPSWLYRLNYSQRVRALELDSTQHNTNSMRVLDDIHRDNFLEYISFFQGCTVTPTHAMVSRADAYFRGSLGRNSPWALRPGQQDRPFLGCRRNYHILMTDGGWNADVNENQIPDTPNIDGSDMPLPDSREYLASNLQTRIYRDNDVGDESTLDPGFSTVADWAFRSWAVPLQDPADLEGTIRPGADFRRAAPEEFTSGTTGAKVTLQPYWNPRYNPATWPHMTTFTIGFSQYALPQSNYLPNGTWNSLITEPSSLLPYGYDGNFADYANGTFAWRAAGGEIGGPPGLPILAPDTSPQDQPVADRGHDMWHAAINGRGSFYAVNRAEDLATAFRQIVRQINIESEPDRSSAATSGTNSTRNEVGLYTAHYDPQRAWKGWITAQTVAPGGATGAATGWSAHTADQLDALDNIGNRTVLTWNDGLGRGVAFQWDALDAAQQTHLGRSRGTLDGHGENRLNYLRGERGMEGTATPPRYSATRPFRQRWSRQGDIVNSAIWYTGAPSSLYPTQDYLDFAQARQGRTPMLYVGGNDGMLHGFSARDGSEKLAYVPRGVIPGLAQLTVPSYNDRHRYFVDGSPMSGDVRIGGQWKTLLVGTLGAGGKGYFALDITDPAGFGEDNAAALVLLDRSLHATEAFAADCSRLPEAQARGRCEEGKDMGHVFAPPVPDDSQPQRATQITQMNNGRWAVVLGNGYNSRNGQAVLLIQYLDQDRELLRLPTPGGGSNNGLSAPRLVDINGDGRPDVVYAGDLLGNLWKFLIASDDPSRWEVALDGKPLFRADPSSAMSITAAPTVRANDRRQVMKNSAGQDENMAVGGMMVAFGTGRNVTVNDPDNPRPGTIYSVLDSTRYKRAGGGARVEPCLSAADVDCKLRADQLPRPVDAHELIDLAQADTKAAGAGVSAGRSFWQVNGGEVDWSTHRGWRFPLPEHGERLLKPMAFFDSSNILAIHTQIPASADLEIDGGSPSTQETCNATALNDERQFLTLLNIMDGKRPSVQIMDTNGDTYYNAADEGMHRMTVSKGAQSQIIQGERIVMKGGKNEEDVFARMPERPARPSWRQLQ